MGSNPILAAPAEASNPRPVPAGPELGAVRSDEHRADRHVAVVEGGPRLSQRQPHPFLVAGGPRRR